MKLGKISVKSKDNIHHDVCQSDEDNIGLKFMLEDGVCK